MVIVFTKQTADMFDAWAMLLDEGKRNVKSLHVKSDAFDLTRRVLCFGESVADLLAPFSKQEK